MDRKSTRVFICLAFLVATFVASAAQSNYTPNIGTQPLTTPIIVVPPTNTPVNGQVLSATGNHTKWVDQSVVAGGGAAIADVNSSTNLLETRLNTKIAAATNDLHTTVEVDIVNATNGLNSTLTAKTLAVMTNNNPAIDGNYKSVYSPASAATYPNNIATGPASDPYRNSGAAFSGTYNRQNGGSGSVLSDLPGRGNDIWDGKRKPLFIVTTRNSVDNSGFIECTINSVTNGVRAFTTNGYAQILTNLGVELAFSLECGWGTNYRSPSGVICWNSNRFPNFINGAYGTCATNLTDYLRTNGFKTIVMLYESPIVPPTNHWPSVSYSTFFLPYAGGPEWDGFGSNPFGATEYTIAMTPDSIHRDVTALYCSGVAGLIFQQDGHTSRGQAQQIARTVGDAALGPYYLAPPDMTAAIAIDHPWPLIYADANNIGFAAVLGSRAKHSMLIGTMLGNFGSWSPEFANGYNLLITESNDGAWPTGSGGVGQFMGQIRRESLMITNHNGYCFFTPATDMQYPFSGYDYKDWQAHFLCSAFFNANIYLMGSTPGYYYATNINFKANVTNANWIKVWQDVTGKPPRCIFLNASNSAWARDMNDGSQLVLMENEDANNTTNLTVTWGQLGIASNTIVNPIAVFTNAYLGLYTNSITWTVPTKSAFLFRITPQLLVDKTTNNGQIFFDSANNGVQTVGPNNRRVAFAWGNGNGEYYIGTNDPAVGITLGCQLTIDSIDSPSAFPLCLRDNGGNRTRFGRDTGGFLGNFRVVGGDATGVSGLSLGSVVDAEYARIGGQGIYMPTNPVAQVPTAPLTRGGYGLWNSNATVYLLLSAPAGNTWISTNLLSAQTPWVQDINAAQFGLTNVSRLVASNGTLAAATLQGGSNISSTIGFGGTNLFHVSTNHVYVRDLNVEGAGVGTVSFSDSDNTQTGTITAPSDFTATRTFTLPDASGTFALISDTAFASSWDGVTTTSPSKNAIYDWAHTFDTDDDGKVNVLDTGAGFVQTDSSGVASASFNGSGLTNLSYVLTTNAINTGVGAVGQVNVTNLTGNVTLGGFSGLVNDKWNTVIWACQASSANRTVTFPANTYSPDGVHTTVVTNGLWKVISFSILPGLLTNACSVGTF